MTKLKLTSDEIRRLLEMIAFARHNSNIASFRNDCTALSNKINWQQMQMDTRERETKLAMRESGI